MAPGAPPARTPSPPPSAIAAETRRHRVRVRGGLWGGPRRGPVPRLHPAVLAEDPPTHYTDGQHPLSGGPSSCPPQLRATNQSRSATGKPQCLNSPPPRLSFPSCKMGLTMLRRSGQPEPAALPGTEKGGDAGHVLGPPRRPQRCVPWEREVSWAGAGWGRLKATGKGTRKLISARGGVSPPAGKNSWIREQERPRR